MPRSLKLLLRILKMLLWMRRALMSVLRSSTRPEVSWSTNNFMRVTDLLASVSRIGRRSQPIYRKASSSTNLHAAWTVVYHSVNLIADARSRMSSQSGMILSSKINGVMLSTGSSLQITSQNSLAMCVFAYNLSGPPNMQL